MNAGNNAKLPNIFETTKIYLPVYFGVNKEIENKFTKDTSFLIKPEVVEMIQKNDNPKDFCLVNKKPEVITVNYYLTDTTITNDYFIEEFEVKELKTKGGNLLWYEVICKDDLSAEKIKEIQLKFIELGIVSETKIPNGNLGSVWMNNLILFQQEHELPVGNLDLMTLEYLGIKK